MSEKKSKPVRANLFSEYLYFLKTYKMWWLMPVMIVFLILGVLAIVGGSQAVVLMYSLF